MFAANAQTLWDLGARCFPDLLPLFERVHLAIGPPHEARVREAIYHQMPRYSFSSGLLQRIPEQTAVIEMKETLRADRVDGRDGCTMAGVCNGEGAKDGERGSREEPTYCG